MKNFSLRHKKNNLGNYEYDLEGKMILEFVVVIKMNSKWRFPSVKKFTFFIDLIF